MRYVSTRGSAPVLEFDDVLLAGLAVDGGLYVPETWPTLESMPTGDYAAVARATIAPFVGDGVVGRRLDDLVESTYARFRHPEVAPVRRLDDDLHLMELFWGPTLSFKDYALQLVGAMFEEVLSVRGNRIHVVGATSGDTGSAAIAALADREGVDVTILFPLGRVSEVQRRQMTTVWSSNVRAVAVEGTFDDCQDLVKTLFGRPDLRRDLGLAAVNSINWARVMTQAAYHVWATTRVPGPVTVSVPTGNFGNVFSAEVARRLGAPIAGLRVANNANHGLADLIDTGRITLSEVVATHAPAMDIQVPSNLERQLFELFDRDGERVSGFVRDLRRDGGAVLDEVSLDRFRRRFSAAWFDDGALLETMARVHAEHGLLIDPHTAAGVAAAADLEGDVVTIATAHPAKFPEAVGEATGVEPVLPDDLADLGERPERFEVIPADPGAVVEVLAGR